MDDYINYLSRKNILALYADMFGISEQAADDALLNEGMLESALASPRNHALYSGADLLEQAAYLGNALAQNHPFQDGNKRTAGLSVQTFLNYNGITLTCSDDYLAAWVIALTLGMTPEVFAACLRSFTEPLAA